MMLSRSNDSLDEDRILSELKCIDQRLNSKTSTQTNIQAVKPQQKYNSFGKYPELQECDRAFLNQINNMQYFSEINSKDHEEDSLFEHEMHFLPHQTAKNHQNAIKPAAKTNLDARPKQMSESIQSKNSKNIDNFTSKQTQYEQILKEQMYIFKKQNKEEQGIHKKKEIFPTKTNKTYPQITKNNSKSNLKSSDPQNKKQAQKYQSNLQNYLHQQIDTKTNDKQKDKTKNSSLKMKTEGVKQNYEDIQTYLSQLASSQIASKAEEDSRSRSRIREKTQGNQGSLECTFKPKILQKSKEMVKSSKNVVERLSTNNIQRNEKSPYQPNKPTSIRPTQQRIDELSQPRRLKTIEPEQVEELPSFKPNLSKKSLEHMSNCTYDVATRNKLWLEQKEEKISRMRKEEEEEKQRREECTHSPAIRMYRGQQDVQFSRFGKQGMVQYFERLSMMKKKNSTANLKKEEGYTTKDISEEISQSNKENANCNLTRERTSTANLYKSKKQTYEDAVKSLHSKIMKLKI